MLLKLFRFPLLIIHYLKIDMEKIITFLSEFFGRASSYSVLKKTLLVLCVAAAVAFAVCSCTSMRSTSVTVDKAEKVDIQITDSIAGKMPIGL